MNPYFRAVRSLIRFIALGLVMVGSLMVALEVLSHRVKGVDCSVLKVIGYSVILLAGIVLVFSAGKVAARLTDEDDEDDDVDPGPQNPEG